MSETTRLLKPEELTPATELTRQVLEQLDRSLLGREELHRLVLIGLLSRAISCLKAFPA